MNSERVCQFMRVESFARVPNATALKNGRRAARQVIAELMREPHASPHIANPLPPTLIFGDPYASFTKAVKMIEDRHDPLGRIHRRDSHVIAVCVVSYPVEVERVRGDDFEHMMLLKWIDDVVAWAKKEFGEKELDCAVLHMDETSPHLHLVLLPPAPGLHPSPLLRASRDALLQAKQAAQNGEKTIYKNEIRKLEQNALKKEGRRLQDSLHTDVSAYYGHLRHSLEPEPRLSPKAYRRRKAAEHSLRKTQELMKDRQREVLDELQRAKKRNQTLLEWQMRLEKEKAQLELQREELADLEVSIYARETAINTLMLQPVLNLVDAMLRRGLQEVRARFGDSAAKILAGMLSYAGKAIGLPDATVGWSAGGISDAELKQMVQQLGGAEQDVRSLVTLESVIQPKQLGASMEEADQDEWEVVAAFGPAA